jgi:hypothetical protein
MQPIEIDTPPGVVHATTDTLAQALAELIAAEPAGAPSEDDLVEAIALDLDDDSDGGSLADFAIPA